MMMPECLEHSCAFLARHEPATPGLRRSGK
jgi:hypothetical protein